MSQPMGTAGIQELLSHADWLRRLATHLVHDQDPDDLTQDTWAAALRTPPQKDGPVEPWLATVLRNAARRRWRAERVRDGARADLTATTPPVATPQELLERAQLQRALAEAVVELDEPYRGVILLRYYEGRSAADIARELGVPAGTVRWRLSEGVERLRKRLDDRHGGKREAWKAVLLPVAYERTQPAAPALLAKGGVLMALGMKTKLGIGAVVLLVIAVLGLVGRGWMAGSHDGGPRVATVRAPRSGLAVLMPAGSVSDRSGTIEGGGRGRGGGPRAGGGGALASGPTGMAVFGPRKPLSTVLTDREGKFRLAGVAPGQHRVSATAVGFAPALSAPFLLAPEEGRHLVLKVADGGHTLQGRVLDDGGGPIPGARVTAWAGSGGTPVPTGPSVLYQVPVDAEGRYRIALPAREYTIRAEAGGYAANETTVPVTRDLQRDLRLHPAARISGRVLDKLTRQPVADAQVTIAPGNRFDRVGPRQVQTDAEGRFLVDDASAGTYQVRVRAGAIQAVGPEVAVVATEHVQGIEVLIDPQQKPAAVEGTVVDTAGKPVPGARVLAGDVAVAGADGRFRLAGVAPGPVRLRVTGPQPELGQAEQTVMVGADGARDVRVVLAVGPVLSGRVIDAGGVPVPGAQVRAIPRGRDLRAVVVETAEDGTFVLSGLPEGNVWLLAWHPTLGVVRQDSGPLAAGRSQPVELRLSAAATIAGTVRFEDGTPAAAVSVAFTGQESGGLYTSVATADDGSYVVSGLPGARYTVRARRKTGPWNISTAVERPDLKVITLGEGEQRRGVDLTLKPGGQSIAGSVTLPDGKPAAGATVIANIEEKGKSWRPNGVSIEHSAVTREDGSFVLDDIEPGSFTLWAARPGMPEVSVTHVASGRRDLRITLRASAALAGVVVDGKGQPVPRFSLNVIPAANATHEERAARDAAGMSQKPVNDPGGAFEWTGLSAGSYEVQARTAEGAGGKQIVTLGEGERKQGVRVVVAAGATITGRAISLESGDPLPGLRMYARLPGRHADATTDAKGAFELTGMLPGEEAEIRAMPGEDLVPEYKRLTVAAGVTRIDAGTFKLMKRDTKKPRRHDGTIRMVVDSRDEQVAVSIVRPGSPADRAGIKVGDRLLSVEGRELRGLGPGAVTYLLGRDPGQTVTMVVQSAGGPARTVTATAEAMGAPPPTGATANAAVPAR